MMRAKRVLCCIIIVGVLYNIFNVLLWYAKRRSIHMRSTTVIKQGQDAQLILDDILPPSIPSLMIIGPSKTGTTSLIVELTKKFPNNFFILDPSGKPTEISRIFRGIAKSIINNDKKSAELLELLNSSGSDMFASNFSLSSLFGYHIKNNDGSKYGRYYQQRFAETIQHFLKLCNSSYDQLPYIFTLEKCPRNFYHPHASYILAKFFSMPHKISFESLGLRKRFKTKGSKVLCIIRNPIFRLNSWYNMHHSYINIVKDLTQAMNDKDVLFIRHLIVNNTQQDIENGINDNWIIIRYLTWFYTFMQQTVRHSHPTHQVMSCLYYPQLLIWIRMYLEFNLLSTHFKLISFDYLSKPETRNRALHDIVLWNQYDIVNGADDVFNFKYNDDKTFIKIHSFQRKFPNILMEPLRNIFEPIQPKLTHLFDRFESNHLFLGPKYQYHSP